jgi:hypothetical protein
MHTAAHNPTYGYKWLDSRNKIEVSGDVADSMACSGGTLVNASVSRLISFTERVYMEITWAKQRCHEGGVM